jgi:quercetin dioxygenase-like cupin family protein
MATIFNIDQLPFSGSSWQFEGYLHDAVNISFFLSNTLPGRGPLLHKHPYEEIFIVQEGKLTFTVNDSTMEASGGQIVIAPAHIPHKFINSGTEVARHVNIHASPRMITTWLEE